jgi:hypothetical protein
MVGIRERSILLTHEKVRPTHFNGIIAPVGEKITPVSLPQLRADELVKTFNDIAKDSAVPVDEVKYSLDSIVNVPYLRYHIILTTKAGYGQIRKFVAILSAEMPNLALDNIRCARADAAAADISCELVFSAFYSRVEHG